jgi:hypothetical protein
MPQNPKTGKTAHRAMTDAEVLEFHINQFEAWESATEVKKGK